MRKLSLFVVFFLLAAGLSSCDYGISKNQPPSDGDVVLQDSAITFADVQERVFNPACIKCHDGSKHCDLRSYDKVFPEVSEIIATVFVAKTMPKDELLTASQIHLLQGWINAGALEFGGTGPTPTTTPPTDPNAVVTFKQIQERIIAPHCFSCHNPTNTDGLSDFSSLSNVKSSITSFYFATVASDSMPPRPKGSDKNLPNPMALSRDEKMLISLWIIDGMQP